VINQCSQIPEAFSHYPAALSFIEQPTLAGTADAVYQAREFIGSDPFVLIFGDNLTNASVSQLIAVYRDQDVRGVLGVFEGGDPARHAVIQVSGSRVVNIEERPSHPKSTLTSAGMFVLEPLVFEAIQEIPPSPSGEYYLPDALQWLLTRYPFGYAIIQGWRININTPRDVIVGFELVLCDRQPVGGSRVFVHESSRVGLNVAFQGIIWVGRECQIESNVCLENVICLDGSRVGAGSQVSWAILEEGTCLPARSTLLCFENPIAIGRDEDKE